MAEHKRERDVLSELIVLYRDLPCLWDLSSISYKDKSQKKTAWEILVQKYKEIDASANEATVKKKLDNLKTTYQREAKKVKESKNSAASDIYRPNLWYFKLMTFLDKKNEAHRTGVDSLVGEDEDEFQMSEMKRKKITRERNLELKKEKLIDIAQELLRTDTNKKESNPFGVYVGKKMEEISPGQQRDLAEKLISEIIFLAKTNNLTFDTKIEIPSRTRHYSAQYNPHSSSIISSDNQSYQYISIQSPPHSSHSHHPAMSPNLHSSIPIQSPPHTKLDSLSSSPHLPHSPTIKIED